MNIDLNLELEKYKYMIDILNASNDKVVITDLKCRKLWSNDDDFFFDGFYLTDYKDQLVDFPIKSEKIAALTYDGKTYTTLIFPLALDVDINGYIAFLKDGDSMTEIMAHSQLSGDLCYAVRTMQQSLSRIISLAGMMESEFTEKDMPQELMYVQRQMNHSVKLLGQLTNLIEFFDHSSLRPSENLIDYNQMLKAIHDECQLLLSKINREIQLEMPSEESRLINVNQKKFTIVFMNLLQNALLYSPKGSPVSIKLEYEKGNAVLTMSNAVLGEAAQADIDERPRMGLKVVKKLFSEMNGKIELVRESEKMNVVLTLPIIEYSQASLLGAQFEDYITERYKPVHTYLNEIIENEK